MTDKKKVLVVAGRAQEVLIDDFDAYVGVDYGALWLVNHRLPVSLAAGDFDSVDMKSMKKINQRSEDVLKVNSHKDFTDLELALGETLQRYPGAKITIIGCLGGRLDHELTNIFLPTMPKFCENAERIRLIDHQNAIYYLRPGEHTLSKAPRYKYIGFAKVGVENFEISSAKYPLAAEADWADIYASNEFISDTMTVKFDSGTVIVIYSSDRNRA